MALKSMTGFGRGEKDFAGRLYIVEVRSVNNRYLDLKMKLPRGYAALEERIRKKVGSMHLRGRVDVMLAVKGKQSVQRDICFNKELAESYEQALRQLSAHFHLDLSLSVPMLAGFPDVITQEEQEEDLDMLWQAVEPVLHEALCACEEMRLQEGGSLASDLCSRLHFFTQTVTHIEAQGPALVAQRQQAMQERIAKLLGQITLDQDRLAQEVALIADKTDVTEEIVRLRSHIDQFSRFLEESTPVGRKLDFLIQEFLREVNTIASKINDASIAHYAVELKSELEKMREQVQNIE